MSRSPCEIPDFDDLRFSTLEHFTSYLHRHPAAKPGATSTTVNEFATTVDWVLHNNDIWKTDPAVVQPIVSYGIQYFDVPRAQVSLFETLHASSEAQRQGLVSLFEKHPATKPNGNPDAFASHVLALVDYQARLCDSGKAKGRWAEDAQIVSAIEAFAKHHPNSQPARRLQIAVARKGTLQGLSAKSRGPVLQP